MAVGAMVALHRHPGQGTADRKRDWAESSTVPVTAGSTLGMAGGCGDVTNMSTAPVCSTGSS